VDEENTMQRRIVALTHDGMSGLYAADQYGTAWYLDDEEVKWRKLPTLSDNSTLSNEKGWPSSSSEDEPI
jgi:hypothetical protein